MPISTETKLAKEVLGKLNAEGSRKEKTNNTYYFNLVRMYKKLYKTNKEPENIDFVLKDFGKVEDKLKEEKMSPNTIKAYLASLLSIVIAYNKKDTPAYNFLVERVGEMQNEYNEFRTSQKMNKRQEKNFISWKDLKEVPDKIYREIEPLLGKEELTEKQFFQIQKWVIASLYLANNENPPNRLEYAGMRVMTDEEYAELPDKEQLSQNFLLISDDEEDAENTEKDYKNTYEKYNKMKATDVRKILAENQVKGRTKMKKAEMIDYILKNIDKKEQNTRKINYTFSIGDYKTSQRYGLRIINVGEKLANVLDIWLKINTSGYLLLNQKLNVMTRDYLSRILTSIFKEYFDADKNVSVDMIRIAFLTDVFPVAQANIRNDIAKLMGHSPGTQLTYSKQLPKEE